MILYQVVTPNKVFVTLAHCKWKCFHKGWWVKKLNVERKSHPLSYQVILALTMLTCIDALFDVWFPSEQSKGIWKLCSTVFPSSTWGLFSVILLNSAVQLNITIKAYDSSCFELSSHYERGFTKFRMIQKSSILYVTHYLVQIHGSHPIHTLPSMLGSVAWSSRQSTWSSTLRSFSLCRARMLCSFSPRATANIPLYSGFFSNPRQSSSLEH